MEKILSKCSSFIVNVRLSKKVLAILFLITFIISLIPVIIACFYTVPIYDDYNLSVISHKSVVNGDSFILGVINNCLVLYKTWQGFMLSNFYPAVQPFVFNEKLYFISCLFALEMIIFSLFYFAKSILINALGFNNYDYLLITVPIVFLIIQFLPSIAEGVYWMDGNLSMVINSIMLIIFALLINLYLSDKKKAKIMYGVISVLLMLIICIDSPITFLTMLLVFLYSSIYLLCKKNKKSPVLKLIVLLTVMYIIGFMVAYFAPGNQVRLQTGMEENSYSILASICYAIFYSVAYTGEWFTLCFIAILLFASVVFWKYAKNSRYSFKYPLLVFILCYSIYAARMSVQLAAGGYLGSERQYNQYYFSFVILLAISWLYFIGWLSKKESLKLLKFNTKKISVAFLVMIIFVFGAGCLNYGFKDISFISTGLSLTNGECQTFYKEMSDRIEKYNDDSISNVVVNPISVYPKCYKEESLTEDSKYWTNSSVARYYNKNSVVLKKKN